MSIENAKQFIEKLKTDKEFAAQVSSCPSKEARKDFVTAAGFHFTAEDLQAIPLADEELDIISGGIYCNREGLCTTTDHAWACKHVATAIH